MTLNNDLNPDQNEHLIELIDKAGKVIQGTIGIFSENDSSGFLSIKSFKGIHSLTQELRDFMDVCTTMEGDLEFQGSNPAQRLKKATTKYQTSTGPHDSVFENLQVQTANLIHAATKVLRHGFLHRDSEYPKNDNCRKNLAEKISDMMGLMTACGINSNVDTDRDN